MKHTTFHKIMHFSGLGPNKSLNIFLLTPRVPLVTRVLVEKAKFSYSFCLCLLDKCKSSVFPPFFSCIGLDHENCGSEATELFHPQK